MERLDCLPNGWPIWQSSDHFKFTLDAVLLAAFPVLRPDTKAVELGAGTGAVSLLLAARGCNDVTGMDINEQVTDLFARSIAENCLNGKVKAVHGDVCKVKDFFVSGVYSLVLANPPYRKLGHGRLRKGGAQTACHEGLAETVDFIKAARYLLKYSGKFALVQLPERLPEILRQCSENKLEPKRLQMVHSFVDAPPSAFLLEAIYGAKPGLQVLAPLLTYQSKQEYSKQLLDIYASFNR